MGAARRQEGRDDGPRVYAPTHARVHTHTHTHAHGKGLPGGAAGCGGADLQPREALGDKQVRGAAPQLLQLGRRSTALHLEALAEVGHRTLVVAQQQERAPALLKVGRHVLDQEYGLGQLRDRALEVLPRTGLQHPLRLLVVLLRAVLGDAVHRRHGGHPAHLLHHRAAPAVVLRTND